MKKLRLTKRNKEDLWGDDGPYSEINLSEQTRVLDGTISRVFYVVEAKINPFTFEFVLKHREEFSGDEAIQQLLDHAEFRGPFDGYVVSAGEEETTNEKSFDLARAYRSMAVENVIKMHNFVIRSFGLQGYHGDMGITISDPLSYKKHVWDSGTGSVIPTEESICDSSVSVHSSAGTKNGAVRYFVIFALVGKNALSKDEIIMSAKVMKKVADIFHVDIENAEAHLGYIMFTVLIDVNIAPADFVMQCISGSNTKKRLFTDQYYITNVSRPTWREIQGFLKSLKNSHK